MDGGVMMEEVGRKRECEKEKSDSHTAMRCWEKLCHSDEWVGFHLRITFKKGSEKNREVASSISYLQPDTPLGLHHRAESEKHDVKITKRKWKCYRDGWVRERTSTSKDIKRWFLICLQNDLILDQFNEIPWRSMWIFFFFEKFSRITTNNLIFTYRKIILFSGDLDYLIFVHIKKYKLNKWWWPACIKPPPNVNWDRLQSPSYFISSDWENKWKGRKTGVFL